MTVYTFDQLRTPSAQADNKKKLYEDLISSGFTSALSWQDGSTPSALVEIEAQSLTEFQYAAQQTLYSGFSELATGNALVEHSSQVYQNARLSGRQTVGILTLSDAGGAPITFNATSLTVSVGQGGLMFDGIPDPTTGQTSYTIPSSGNVSMFVRARVAGSAYNVVAGTINTFVRGSLPGVVITNNTDWLSQLSTMPGADDESEDSLRNRNRTKWGTLGVGSPASAYENWVRSADPAITRVSVFTNLNPMDPGNVTILIAGDAGTLGGAIVAAAQNAIAPKQVGGNRIPATARAVVAAALNNTIMVAGVIYLDATMNAQTFQQLVAANVKTFQESLAIGATVSWARVLEVILYPAGVSSNTVLDVQNFTLNGYQETDVVQAYYSVAALDLTGLVYISQ